MCGPRDGAQVRIANVRSSGMVSRMAALSIAALIVRKNPASKALAIERLNDKRPKPLALPALLEPVQTRLLKE